MWQTSRKFLTAGRRSRFSAGWSGRVRTARRCRSHEAPPPVCTWSSRRRNACCSDFCPSAETDSFTYSILSSLTPPGVDTGKLTEDDSSGLSPLYPGFSCNNKPIKYQDFTPQDVPRSELDKSKLIWNVFAWINPTVHHRLYRFHHRSSGWFNPH